ncbi:neuronal acetylcholine receptor subunit alpha-10-like [Pristis pectinata]|uniref:neuronal acetylcholine receptor subunit alpha-10-like n=1 Tax=Pristis pectinata TaxID=685728 RepID=UPI00223D4166|nr:neuronal acetylcholine receptor subunit alpha-10-like [Pristis pectinata]
MSCLRLRFLLLLLPCFGPPGSFPRQGDGVPERGGWGAGARGMGSRSAGDGVPERGGWGAGAQGRVPEPGGWGPGARGMGSRSAGDGVLEPRGGSRSPGEGPGARGKGCRSAGDGVPERGGRGAGARGMGSRSAGDGVLEPRGGSRSAGMGCRSAGDGVPERGGWGAGAQGRVPERGDGVPERGGWGAGAQGRVPEPGGGSRSAGDGVPERGGRGAGARGMGSRSAGDGVPERGGWGDGAPGRVPEPRGWDSGVRGRVPEPVGWGPQVGRVAPAPTTAGEIRRGGMDTRGSRGTHPASGRIARQLLRDLWANYSSVLRPVLDTEQVLNVTLQVTLFQIIDMDERNQVLTTYLWTRQVWRDAFYRWNKEDYGGLDNIRVPSSYLWRPDIVLYNSVDYFTGPADTNVVVRHDGLVTWDSPAIVRSSCRLDVRWFPFDRQRCPLTFGSWTHGGQLLDLWPGERGAQLSDFVEHVEWEVLGMPARRELLHYGCCSQSYAEVTFTLALRRRPAFYLHNLLLPCVLLSTLTPLTFHLPAPSGEKVSLGITLLLAFTVFQLMVAEIMPPAESPPLIGRYYIVTMAMITTSTAMTVLVMNIHYCGPEAKPVPRWAKVLILGHLARVLAVHELGEGCRGGLESGHRLLGEGEAPGEEDEEEGSEGAFHHTNPLCVASSSAPHREVDQGSGGGGSCPHHWQQLASDVAFISSCVRQQREAQRQVSEWRKLSRVVDRLFTWTFTLMVTVMSVFITAQML